MRAIFISCLIFILSAIAQAGEIQVSVSEVSDNRTTGQFFGGLELKLKVISDMISDARGIKLHITRAVDNTGRALLKDDRVDEDFTKPDENMPGQAELTVKLKNPARKATAVKEINGEIIVYIPGKDPNSTAVIKEFMNQAGNPLPHQALKAAQVEITVLTKKQYDEMKAAKEKEAKEEASKMGIAGEMAQALLSMFGDIFEASENSIILDIKDEKKKVIAIEFEDEAGQKISSYGTMTMGETKVYDFDKPMPANARMVVFLSTPKSFIKEPMKLTNIALP
jgi:hypothetical protein